MLFIARILDGISGGNISTAQAYIADITEKEDRTQGMSLLMAALGLGLILGPILGGLLSVYGYGVPALVAGSVALIAAVMTYFFLPESREVLENKQITINKENILRKLSKIININDFKNAINHPNVGLLLTLSFMAMFSFSLVLGTFALFTEHGFGFTAKTNGILFTYIGVLGILIQLFLIKKILKWIPESVAISISLLSMSISLGLIAVGHDVSSLVLAATLLTFGNSIALPLVTGLISKVTSKNEQGNIAGTSQSINSLALLIGPLLGTYLYSVFGMRSPYFVASGLLFITFLYAVTNLKQKFLSKP